MASNFFYKKNAFLIVDPNEQLSTGAEFLYIGQGRKSTTKLLYSASFETEDDFDYAIALDHELVHYIQDLTMNACIADGFLTDFIKGCLVESSKIDGIEFPLPFNDSAKFDEVVNSLQSEDDKNTLITLKLLNDIYNTIFINSFEDENFEKYGLNISDQERKKYRLTFKDLVESHAYHKGYWDYYCRNQEHNNGCEIIHSLTYKNNLYPYSYDNDIFSCENFRENIFYRKMYMMPYYLALISFPIENIKKNYVNYCKLQIPYKYSSSIGNWIHALFLLIIETALSIPGIEYIIKQVQEGKNMNEFSPSYRFFKILDTIKKNPDFLFKSVEGEDYCITFFNYVAADNGWLNYDETNSTMIYSLQHRASLNDEVIVHYQMNLWIEKNKDIKHFIHKLPIHIINRYALPLLIQQDMGINIEFHMGNLIQDESTLTDFYTEYFRSDIKKYQCLEGSKDDKEIMSKIYHNCHGAIREIVNRLFAADLREAQTKNKEYRCPLANGGCQNRCGNCSSFKSFDQATVNCSNKILRTHKFKLFVENGNGNEPDCMYLNYMLDNGFNINKINFKKL